MPPRAAPSASRRVRFYLMLFFAFWTALSTFSLVIRYREDNRMALEFAREEALASYNKDLVYRRWNAGHGGVYVPVTEKTPPNPYLTVPNRDLETTTGLHLTLINPAYMTRQAHELGREQYGVRGHITSLDPLRPENAPDAWEAQAMRRIAGGEKEVAELSSLEGASYYRLMRPLFTEERCLTCHARQGYKTGDLRGGLSVSVPMAPYVALLEKEFHSELLGHLALWLTGSLLLLFGGGFLARSLRISEESAKNLVESEAQYKQLADASPYAIYVHQEGRFVFANPAGCALLGADTPAELLGRPILDVVHPDYREAVLRRIRTATQTGAPVPAMEEIFVRRDATPVDVEVTATATLYHGAPAMQVLARDISERRGAERKLRESEANLRRSQEIAHVGSWRMERADGGERWSGSDEFYKILGLEPGAGLTRQTFLQCLHPEDQGRVRSAWRAAWEGAGPPEWEFRILADGQTKWISATVRFDRDDAGAVTGASGTAQDITERKRAEQERETLQTQVVQSQKMEAIGLLAGGVAHDFNNMLGVILGHAELALGDIRPENPLRENLEEIKEAAQRSTAITRQLLAFARKQPAAPKPVDLNETIGATLKMIRRLIGEDIDLSWTPGFSLWRVKIDPTQVDQILANLAANARDAIVGVGKVSIRTENVSIAPGGLPGPSTTPSGDYVKLTLSDDGCGIAKEQLPNIFEPFFTTKGKGRGTGLGLATVYGIVRQNGGTIDVDSEPGKGTTFTIHLPRLREEAEDAPREDGPEPVKAGNGETILLVEDEKANLLLAERMLTSLGYRVLAAQAPAQAVRVAQTEQRIDLLVTDVVMPEMNGRELADAILALRPGTRCLYVSGYTANVIAHHGVLEQGVNFLPKPYTVKELSRKVREILDEKPSDQRSK